VVNGSELCDWGNGTAGRRADWQRMRGDNRDCSTTQWKA